MASHGRFVAKACEQPGAGGCGIHHGFLGREGFGGDDKKGFCRIQVAGLFIEVRAIDVGDKTDAEMRIGIEAQGFTSHGGTEVRPADADIENVADGLSGVAFPFPAPDGLGEGVHLLKNGAHLGHHVSSVHEDRRVGTVSERDMQNGAVFSHIENVAPEHGGDGVRKPACVGKVHKEADGIGIDAVFGIVETPAGGFGGEAFCAVGILSEEGAQVAKRHGAMVGLEGIPFRLFDQAQGIRHTTVS